MSDRPDAKFRMLLASRKVAQAATACLVMMTRGDLASLTVAHWLKAAKTGCAGGAMAVLLSFTPLATLYAKRWSTAVVAGVSTVAADWWSHGPRGLPSREALLTGLGAFMLSYVVSMTPIGARFEALAAAVKDRKEPEKPRQPD